ncbi:MAG: hypothetical protein K5770_04295 [Lachnospiraceae bacterium]|nr:hypothetical protein [Lachnospiraceae bacterium]
MNKRTLLFRGGLILVLIIIAALMFVIGRGHTVYFDNKAIEYDGKKVEAPYKIEVNVGGERVAKLYEDERGMASTMGQNFSMIVEITQEKGGNPVSSAITLTLPYSMDGIILNIPAMMAGLSPDAYLTEFIPTPETEEEVVEEIVTDEFALEDV